MKVAVCVKETPEAAAHARIDPQTLRLDRSGAAALNPFDTHALEEALRIREKSGEGEVVAILMGPPGAADSLRKALAIGADRSVHLADDALAGSDLVATARALAAVLRREEADLVLLGQQGSDSDGAVLWSALGEALELPVVSQAASVELGAGKVKAKRQTEFGYDVIEAHLPCVVAVSDAINEPRYPSLKGIMGAKRKPQETLALGDLGLAAGDVGSEGSRTEVYALAEPPSRGESQRIEDEGGDAAAKIVSYLAERKLV
jgi:electron transfer flavoprotein beta subunit